MMNEFLEGIGVGALVALMVAAVFDVRFMRWACKHWLSHADGIESYRVGRRDGLAKWAARMPKALEVRGKQLTGV